MMRPQTIRRLACAAACVALAMLLTGCSDATEPAPGEATELTPEFIGEVAADLQTVDTAIAAGPFSPEWESLEKIGVPDWYLDAKFGIFIHWGVYCVPAFGNEWYPRLMYLPSSTRRGLNYYEHHRKTFGPQKEFGYKDFIPKFGAEKFNADEWAALFKEAGARYVVPVGEHHDGFPMYACSYTKWDASEMGPSKDIVALLEKSVRAQGMNFGVSSHRAFNFNYYPRREDFDTVDPANFGLYGKPHEGLGADMKTDTAKPTPPPTEEFKDNWLVRTAEMAEKFKADLVWFDFGIGPRSVKTPEENYFGEHIKRFAAYYYNRAAKWGKVGAINYKHHAMTEKAAVLDIERGKLDQLRELFWQTDTSVSYNSWGYITNHDYKPVNSIVDDLADIVSKNGCLLLNIGPKADGTIPEKEVEMLREIGQWLKVNGEAIYGTRHWKVYGEGPTGSSTGSMTERKDRDKKYRPSDIRFTKKGKTLYAIALAWPESGKLTVKSLGLKETALGEVKSVSLLGHDGELEFSRNEAGLTISVPDEQPCDFAFAFKIQ